jgi:hypothetical protein
MMGGMVNPFQLVTNLYAEKNVQGLQTGIQLANGTVPTGGAVNAGQYLRAVRLMVRTVTAGAGSTATADGTAALFSTLALSNVDGSEILYAMGSFSHWLIQTYGRPWQRNMAQAYDYVNGNSPSATFMLQPEVRWSAAALANTDTRSQYRYDAVLAPMANVGSGFTTAPTLSIQPYMEAWAQPDDSDLQGSPNQPVPPGINLQNKRRHQVYNMNAAGNNTLLSTLTGNARRLQIYVTRNASGVRVDGFSDPLYWQLDNRSLGKLSPDLIWQWSNDFYTTWQNNLTYSTAGTATAPVANAHGVQDTGIYVFPRFLNPGDITGQGWLYTANNTKNQIETATANSAVQAEEITDEMYPVGEVDPSLVDI